MAKTEVLKFKVDTSDDRKEVDLMVALEGGLTEDELNEVLNDGEWTVTKDDQGRLVLSLNGSTWVDDEEEEEESGDEDTL